MCWRKKAKGLTTRDSWERTRALLPKLLQATAPSIPQLSRIRKLCCSPDPADVTRPYWDIKKRPVPAPSIAASTLQLRPIGKGGATATLICIIYSYVMCATSSEVNIRL